ncbi:hypothetical protein ABAC460_08775 [Asticcacaulis sp. AC460]|uniref:glycoside hydrolase n=1 Tax=Asticcacaulis sp. AC460 TaxID=1282360 RepID=UPI0003C3C3A1|nr:glycoside hydrolase [Asticcacaulis sp. AC460]ESQ90571.1 hypothetical protein ABAC460_08775 [Asticcacaulis sp. AC460]
MKRRHFLAAGIAAALPLTARAQTQTITLENPTWRIDINPANLAITTKDIPVSQGVTPHTVSHLTQTTTTAEWTWDDRFKLTCQLIDRDLNITVTATETADLDLIDQPATAFGRGLILPLAEGYYVPAGDPVWRDFMISRMDDVNSSQDLSLPLWSQDHDDFTLTWLLLNPFNNRLLFRKDGDGLAVKLSHSFISLAPTTPMQMTLHLGEGNPIAGALRYRKHLIDTNTYETLESKFAGSPEARKLLGAAHIYLWGNGLLAERDVRDWPLFLKTLRGPSSLPTRLRATFESDATAMLAKVVKPIVYEQSALINAVNAGLDTLARQTWQTDEADTDKLIAAYPALRQEVQTTFGAALTPDAATWGRGLSQATANALTQAGLKKLWVGMADGWEGGLWHPEAVGAFVEAGYLVAPYDSYETAIPPGERPDWATAQLGRHAYESCGIVMKDGSTKSGFQKTGHYTNTICMRPKIETRVAALAKATGFNSWFLDAYATGMVFDDYRPGFEMTMARQAAENEDASRWISQKLGLPAGSECGNATTARGVFFGHGLLTPVIGWGDPDLMKDKTSPYYLGNWFPSEQPGAFFKPVPMKEPYRTVYFKPQTRLPLYQAVFHGSVITTHHWSLDNFKLSNVRTENELAQLLYNAPPLYNLSSGTLKTRLPAIVRQDAFFRPLHETLGTLSLDGFAWLSDDRLVQETRFSDGSRLIANFFAEPRTVAGLNLPAVSITALMTGQAPTTYVA